MVPVKKFSILVCPAECPDDLRDCVEDEPYKGCQCVPGYEAETPESDCKNINECLTKCQDSGQSCTDTEGSYECTCAENYYQTEAGFCILVCPDVCQNNSKCIYPARGCECSEGFTSSEDPSTCEDIDECSTKCGDDEQKCVNTDGSFTCGCAENYVELADGTCEPVPPTCANIECDGDHNSCRNNDEGEPQCFCDVGYFPNPDTTNCENVDECETNCLAEVNVCNDTDGSFTCSCIAGYEKAEDGSCNEIFCPEKKVICGEAPEDLCEDQTDFITFPSVKVGYHSNSYNVCSDSTPNAGKVMGTRECAMDGTWKDPTWLSSCNTTLEDLSQITIESDEEREEVVSTLEVMTVKSEELTSEDINATVTVLNKVTSTNDHLTQDVSSSVVTTVGNLMESPEMAESGQLEELLDTIDSVTANVILSSDGENFTEISNQLSVIVIERSNKKGEGIGQGLRTLRRPNITEEGFRSDQFQLFDDETLTDEEETSELYSTIYLSGGLLDKISDASKISFVTFGNSNLFQSSSAPNETSTRMRSMKAGNNNEPFINSFVMSTGAEDGVSKLPDGEEVRFSTKLIEALNSSYKIEEVATCVHRDGIEWKNDSCRLIIEDTTDKWVSCGCNLFADFAVKFKYIPPEITCAEENIPIIVGCSFSIFTSILVIVLVLVVPKAWESSKFRSAFLFLNLSIGLLGLNITFLVINSVDPETISCAPLAAVLHFFLVFVFAFMNNEVANLYITLAKPLLARKGIVYQILVPAMVGWGWLMPLLFVGITVAVNIDYYISDSLACERCWIQSDMVLYLVYIPLSILFGINLVLYTLISVKICLHKTNVKLVTSSTTFDIWMNWTTHICFNIIVVITWIQGLLAINISFSNSVVMSYIFAVFNVIQGISFVLLFLGRNTNLFSSFLSITYRDYSPYDPSDSSIHGDTTPGQERRTRRRTPYHNEGYQYAGNDEAFRTPDYHFRNIPMERGSRTNPVYEYDRMDAYGVELTESPAAPRDNPAFQFDAADAFNTNIEEFRGIPRAKLQRVVKSSSC
uniref:adhesion G protein-coupled receptor L4-like n=1 Tax=Styela clava TaxID=7725 RepID=UPI00193972F4|nr:adhesion G protein-coupled receptor L4-like [Styela clava]